MPDLSSLPPWAVLIFMAAAGIGFIVIRSGILDGIKKPPGERANTGEIVALTVDSRSIDKLSGEVAGSSVALHELVVAVKDHTRAEDELARHTAQLSEELRETTREVRELTREVSKARP